MVAATNNEPSAPRSRPKYASAYTEAVEMQAVIMQDIVNPATSPAVRPKLVEAWDKLEDRKRILRNKPLPGALVHEKVRHGRALRYPSGASQALMMHDVPSATPSVPSVGEPCSHAVPASGQCAQCESENASKSPT